MEWLGEEGGGVGLGMSVQETDCEDSQNADFAPDWDLEFGDALEREEEDGKVGDDVNGRGGDEGGLEVDTAAFERGVPDASTGHALEDCGTEVGEVKGKVGPDEDVDEIVGFARSRRVEEAPVHEENGQLGEEDGRAVEHFHCVC